MCIRLFGYGAWGEHHAAAIDNIQGVHLDAIAVHGARRPAHAGERHSTIASDLGELLSRLLIDPVDVVLANHPHGDAAMAAFDAGKHVALEKPIAVTTAECDSITA